VEIYEIEIQGKLDLSWNEWFPGMEFRYSSDGKTRLTGSVPDQTALHAMITRIRDLGVPLLKVERLPALTTSENT
jgi:hypothetical protein